MNDVKEILFRCGVNKFSVKRGSNEPPSQISQTKRVSQSAHSTNTTLRKISFSLKYTCTRTNSLRRVLWMYLFSRRSRLRNFLDNTQANEQGIQTNPILKEWYNKDLYSKFEKTFHAQGGMRSIEKQMNESTRKLIQMWKSSGKTPYRSR